MPKVSLSSKDAVAGGLGVQEGLVEIVTAEVRVHQFPPNSKTGQQQDPGAFVVLGMQRLEPTSGERMDEDPIDEFFGIGKLEKFHPGMADSAQDEEPEDQGDELDTAGNCIYAVDDNAKLNKNCKWIRMALSMEECGFKQEVLSIGFMPDLVGTKMIVKTIAIPKMPNSTSEREPTALVCEKIVKFPYEKKGGKGPAVVPAKQAGKAAPGKAAGKPAAAAAASNGDGDVDELSLKVLGGLLEANSGKTLEMKKFINAAQVKLMRDKIPAKAHKGILEQLKDTEWLAAQAESLESFAYDEDNAALIIQ
ncbi:MAG TPA: hypothetical protein VF077_03970 [Nitrospiraceae bacterium]